MTVSRRYLLNVVKVMFGLLGCAFFYILLVGIGGGQPASIGTGAGRFSELVPGQPKIFKIEGRAFWVSRLNKEQRALLGELEEELVSNHSGCSLKAEYCAISAATRTEGILLSYSKVPPPQVADPNTWYGGFVDPTSGACFDLLGRPYRLGNPGDSQGVEVLEFQAETF